MDVSSRSRDPNGIRTRVTAVKGRCPRPLDDRVGKGAQYPRQCGGLQGISGGGRGELFEEGGAAGGGAAVRDQNFAGGRDQAGALLWIAEKFIKCGR